MKCVNLGYKKPFKVPLEPRNIFLCKTDVNCSQLGSSISRSFLLCSQAQTLTYSLSPSDCGNDKMSPIIQLTAFDNYHDFKLILPFVMNSDLFLC
jgi:hypothetical protein